MQLPDKASTEPLTPGPTAVAAATEQVYLVAGVGTDTLMLSSAVVVVTPPQVMLYRTMSPFLKPGRGGCHERSTLSGIPSTPRPWMFCGAPSGTVSQNVPNKS